jgi:phage-related protein (TIGR01555 family)
MLGKLVHATRLQTVITRPVSDMLKPPFNFGGISMSQLAEPYVDNWLRTRQSVADLISNFSIIVLATAMDESLQGDDADELFKRIELFTLTRNNRGAFVIDKDREEMDQIAVPLGGLAELQSQSQEQMCSVSHIPAVILLGIAPTGFGNLAEGEILAFYDWIRAIQEAFWRKPIETSINILQLLMYGEIDPDIVVNFEPLYQMTPKELAEIRTADANTDSAYIDRGVIDPLETRIKIARNPESGYQGLDTTKVPAPQGDGAAEPDDGNSGEQDGKNEDVP